MTKQELAAYCIDLLDIMDSKSASGRAVGATLSWEYERSYNQLVDILRKEKEADEARNRPNGDRGEVRADSEGSLTRRS